MNPPLPFPNRTARQEVRNPSTATTLSPPCQPSLIFLFPSRALSHKCVQERHNSQLCKLRNVLSKLDLVRYLNPYPILTNSTYGVHKKKAIKGWTLAEVFIGQQISMISMKCGSYSLSLSIYVYIYICIVTSCHIFIFQWCLMVFAVCQKQ